MEERRKWSETRVRRMERTMYRGDDSRKDPSDGAE